jgi:hypothetical protein
MAPRFTQPVTEMSTGRFLGVERPASKADSLSAICGPTVWTIWDPRHITALQASTACCRDSFTNPNGKTAVQLNNKVSKK